MVYKLGPSERASTAAAFSQTKRVLFLAKVRSSIFGETRVVQRPERNLISMSANSSSTVVSPPPTKHEVFLSFRGEDTRDNFTSHLYAALCRKDIKTFMDDELGRGEEISPALQRAIEESMIYVIIFSEHYAFSTWCLDELTKILECKERYGRHVIPVFYKVDPSNIRRQRESYAEAFVQHEQRFKDNVDKVNGWKAALTEAAGLSGWDSKTMRYEYELVEDIVEDILIKLNHSFSSDDYQGLVGIDRHIEQIQSLLHVESEAVQIIGIWGIGGIGKTTIARAIYRKLETQFSSRTFVENFQEEIKKKGTQYMRSELLSQLLKKEMRSPPSIRSNERLKRAKVLLVLDDVNNSGQLKDLIGGHGSFGQGSRIIVTSRDMQVLKNAEADEMYEVKEMNFQDSLQLFSSNAFKQNYTIESYMDLSEKVLNYAKGIPLALKVLGSLLYDRTKEEWESALQKLEKLSDPEIFNVLKLSYDGLDDEQKDIFLDIACFYRGHDKNTVQQTLDGCGFSAAIGMRILIDKGLISILKGKIVMHDLIQEMGKEIVRQQCANDPGKRSRLWKHEDIYHVLRKIKGTDAVQCIFLDMCQIKQVQLHSETFKRMDNLRLLQFYKSKFRKDSKVYIPAFLERLPDALRFLRWDGFPQRSLPLDFWAENLVNLDMRDSHLEKLWVGDQHLPSLKRLDLRRSWNLIQIPDLSRCPNIEEVILSHCRRLVQVYSSSFLNKLNCLWLNGCHGLMILNLPSNILSKSSGLIVLDNCYSLQMFSVSNMNIGNLLYGCSHRPPVFGALYNAGIGMIEEYYSDSFEPSDDDENIIRDGPVNTIHLLNFKLLREGLPSFPSHNELGWLDLSNCKSLTSLPIDLCKLKFLRKLYLRGCSNLEEFPEIEETMENLTVLMLDWTAIQKLPLSLHHLVGLEELSLQFCRRLEFIPSSIGSVSKLSKLDLAYCESLETLPSSIFKLKLTKLDLHGCSMLRTFPEILEPAESFAHLRLTETAVKEIPSLDYLVGLRTLRLNLCEDLEFLPNSIGNVKLLTKLDVSGCDKLSEIPSDIGRLSSLRELSLHGSGIVNLPESIAHLSILKSLDLSDCKRLECIPELPPFLKHLGAFDCPSIRRVSRSRFKLSSDFKEGIFEFYLTNSQKLDPSARTNIVAEAWLRVLQDAYRSVFFCFPGSAVPHLFPHRSTGHSVTLDKDFLNGCKDNRFIGFALCTVLGLEGMADEDYCRATVRGFESMNNYVHSTLRFQPSVFSYEFKFESDDGIHSLPGHDNLKSYIWGKNECSHMVRDHTLLWKYELESASISHVLSHANKLTFQISKLEGSESYFRSCGLTYKQAVKVKECGICPLYAKEKDDNAGAGDCSNFQRFSEDDIGEPSAKKQKKGKGKETIAASDIVPHDGDGGQSPC